MNFTCGESMPKMTALVILYRRETPMSTDTLMPSRVVCLSQQEATE